MFKKYIDDEQFNFQLNRFFGNYNIDDIIYKTIVPNIKDMESWYEIMTKLASESEIKNDYNLASAYYLAADFYLEEKDEKKKIVYEKYKENFYKNYYINNKKINVPYEDKFIPSMFFKSENNKNVLIIHGGYDSYLEEISKFADYLKDLSDIVIFEGPGQGECLRNGLNFTNNWEKPIAKIIDYFNLEKYDNITLLGISFGGYLCMRAAAFEKRINNVICFDIFYTLMDSITMKINEKEKTELLDMLNNNNKEKLNKLLYNKMEKDTGFKWMINKGIDNFGVKTPFDLFKTFLLYSMKDIEELITQSVLLLAGENDHYVPIERLEFIEKRLINAKSITTKKFSKESGGDQHCQCGRYDLAINEIREFIIKNI